MRRVALFLTGILIAFSVNAQPDITIGLVMPDTEMDGIRPDAYKILKSKLEKMLTSSGVSSYGGDFVMYPVVNVIEENLIEGGIKNFFKVKIELSLNVANLTSQKLFSSETWPLTGTSERVKSDAVRNAFVQFKTSDPHFGEFLEQTKSKIVDYYVANKEAILSQASTLAATDKYDEAFAILSSYPSQVDGYNDAQEMIKKIYKQYVDANAAKILSEARAAFSTKKYDLAVTKASQIVPESSYYADAMSIIEQVRSAIKDEEDAANERAQKALEIAADVEKTRINAVASVAKAYYNRRVVNYNTVRIYR